MWIVQSTPLPHSDDNGTKIRNEILLSLPREEPQIIFAKLEFVRLGVGTVEVQLDNLERVVKRCVLR